MFSIEIEQFQLIHNKKYIRYINLERKISRSANLRVKCPFLFDGTNVSYATETAFKPQIRSVLSDRDNLAHDLRAVNF